MGFMSVYCVHITKERLLSPRSLVVSANDLTYALGGAGSIPVYVDYSDCFPEFPQSHHCL